MYANTDIFIVNAANFQRDAFNCYINQTDLLMQNLTARTCMNMCI